MKKIILYVLGYAFSFFFAFVFHAGMMSMFGSEHHVSDPETGSVTLSTTYPGQSVLPIAVFIGCAILASWIISKILKDD